MKPALLLKSATGEPAARPAEPRDLSGLIARREQAARALAQTRDARKSQAIQRAADAAAGALAHALTGLPPPATKSQLRARVVAAADSKAGLPVVPLADLQVRLNIDDKISGKATSDILGQVEFDLPAPEKGKYELEVIAPDGTVLTSQRGTWTSKQPAPVHRLEAPRSAQLQPHLERARHLEQGLLEVRRRADLAGAVAAKALHAQQELLTAYLAEVDSRLGSQPATRSAVKGSQPPPNAKQPDQPPERPPPPARNATSPRRNPRPPENPK